MEFTGKVTGISQDYLTGLFTISFSVNERTAVRSGFDAIKDVEKLDIKAVKHRERRSLDANAYFHVLVGKLADALTISKTRCKNILICRYGQPELIDGEPLVYKTNAPVTYMLEQEMIHAQCVGSKQENGKVVLFYRIYRGSHTLNTAEMSILIDGTVAECKDMGIETMPPAELARMLERWKPKE
jgi:hypothetical protein